MTRYRPKSKPIFILALILVVWPAISFGEPTVSASDYQSCLHKKIVEVEGCGADGLATGKCKAEAQAHLTECLGSFYGPKPDLSTSASGVVNTSESWNSLPQEVKNPLGIKKLPIPTPKPVVQQPTPAAQPASPGQKPADSGQGTTADGGSTPATGGTSDPAQAQAEASSDIASCGSVSAQAVRCCGNPQSCLTGATSVPASTTSSGIADACQQAKQLGTTSADLNSRMSTACATPYYSCTSTCDSLLNKYRSLQSSCAGCASQSVYDDTVNQLSSSRSSCSNLESRVLALGNQAIEGAGGNAQGNACNQASSLTPASQSGGEAKPESSLNPSALASNCAASPSAPGCQSAQVQNEKRDTGSAGFQAPKTKQDANGFNPADTSTVQPGGPLFSQNGVQSQASAGATVVPNNSGGAIPGQSGSGSGAQLDSGPRGGRGPVPSGGSVTDILQGERSGGYSQPASNGSGFESDDNGRNPRPQRFAGDASAPTTLDLKKYLPGGSRDPAAGRLGGIWGSREINGQGEDIFKLISVKMNEKCKLGILWRCVPEG